MKVTVACASLLLAGSGQAAKVTPVQKVIQLLQGMQVKGKNEKHEEQVQFAAFEQFCNDVTVDKQRAIEEAAEHIDSLRAEIAKYLSDAEGLGREIVAHDKDIASWTRDSKAATEVRSLEKADYTALHADYSESVYALKRAIAVLKKQAYDSPQAAAALTQLKAATLIPADAKRALDLFLQEDPEELAWKNPEAQGYEFQSQGIIEMLEKLLDKFVDERTAAEKEEMNSKHAFDMLIQDLSAQLAQAKDDRTSKVTIKMKKMQAKADAEGDLQDTINTKQADETYLTGLTGTCQQKAADFETRQQLRGEELDAIAKAIQILSGDKVSGNSEKYLPQFVQSPRHSLAQLRSSALSPEQEQERAASFLREQASRLNSRVLATIAMRASDDPFGKVKQMIKDLIMRLMDEANEEAEHKGWCDTELATNEQTRKEKTQAVETLHAEIDQLEASMAKLQEEISELSKAVADMNKAMAEATKFRQDEKANNEQTIMDADEAQTAVGQALTVLKEFYAKAGDATAFAQQQPEAPVIFDSSYKGMQAENGGVVGMLEVIQSDFARLEADTTAAEASAQQEYDTFMTDSKVDVASKSKDVEHKTAKKQDQSSALTTKQGDLEGTQKELDLALAYFDKLKPSCVDSGTTYEDRVARRKDEIESLQEALRILNGEDLA